MLMDQNISDVTDYSAFGEAIVGDEGSPWGEPDTSVGANDANTSDGYLPWGGDLADGALDTGPVAFQLDVNLATGVDVLTVGDSTLTFAGGASGTVGSVEVRVGACVAAQVSLSYVGVNFYQNGALQEADSAPGLSVDTTDPASPPSAASILIVTPASSNNDEVVVAGSLRMIAPAGTYPNGKNIFCDAYVKPAAAAQ
jgi:hypothetical protein